MDYRKAFVITFILSFLALIIILAFFSSVNSSPVFMYVALAIAIAASIIYYAFFRCPHCRRFLYSLRKYCPNCGEELKPQNHDDDND